ncbi:MAG: DEAD/DEAH box helicase [bacterium]|nr:DEAD/DEAH box helicase [bacterium]
MTAQYLARSAANEKTPSQSYLNHIWHVLVRGRCYLRKVLLYARGWDAKTVKRVYELAAEYHDLGKLDDDNQKTLALPWDKRVARLPLPHEDAGVSYLMSQEYYQSMLLVFAHHSGLPDLNEMGIGKKDWRDNRAKERVNGSLSVYLTRHESSVRSKITPKQLQKGALALLPPDVRVLFSCLTHADHGDAARASQGELQRSKPPKLRASERLAALRCYVDGLSSGGEESARNQLRAAFFTSCFESQHESGITFCDAPVGTGKTTAIMANLLATAARHKLRRIFVILPFTNIITQSAQVYRKALLLPGEHEEGVVAEVHHRADFDDAASRKLTALWDAPIVVTTAVAFFETLASARPSTLRRLQNFPGSAVFLDEAHAMLPAKLLPLAWQWIQHAASAWSCYWILASGSLFHFWTLNEFGTSAISPVNVIPNNCQKQLQTFESDRIRYRYRPESMDLNGLAAWLRQLDGPVIVVLNTVHTAAAAAKVASEVFGEGNILHLSTSLTPKDREITLDAVKTRLKLQEHTKWCLIATSCVEAGMDLSFKTGVRERASLLSLLQLAGRVNRNAEYGKSDVWTVTLDGNSTNVVKHPAFDVSSRILADFFADGRTISPDLCTEAIRREIRESGSISEELVKQEGIFSFQFVETKFRVIEDDTQLAVVDPALVQRLKNFEDVSWREIQTNSIRVRKKILAKLAIEESSKYPGVWLWNAEYSSFLGYMEAVLKLEKMTADGCAII